MRFTITNQEQIKVYRSKLFGGWNWNLLRNGKVVAGGVDYATEQAAYAAAMASR